MTKITEFMISVFNLKLIQIKLALVNSQWWYYLEAQEHKPQEQSPLPVCLLQSACPTDTNILITATVPTDREKDSCCRRLL